MKTVYKYPLNPPGEVTKIMLPLDAKPLSADFQNGHGVLWCLVRDNAITEERSFFVIGTGWPFPAGRSVAFIDTFFQNGGALVWHVFELL